MWLWPFFSTYITELMPTSTGHMIAALILFDDEVALFALPIVKIVLEESFLKWFTVALMTLKKAFWAKLTLASITNCNDIFSCCYDSITILLWTKTLWVIFLDEKKLLHFFEFLLYLVGKLFKQFSIHIDLGIALLIRALHFLKAIDFEDSIVVQAGLTEIILMRTVTHIENLWRLFAYNLFTDPTFCLWHQKDIY